MKALQLVTPRSFELVRVPVPRLDSSKKGWLLVQVIRVSMCGSDIPYYTGSKRFRTYPMLPGAPVHECLGRVVESTAEGFVNGDLVVAIPDNNQGLAEYFLAPADKAVVLPPALAGAPGSCLIQPLSTVMNAVDRLGDVSGRPAAVIGLGSIGLFFVWLLKQRGAGPISGVDPVEHRCRLAKSLGAATTFSMRSIELVHSTWTKPDVWQPPEICIEAVGHQPDTLNECIELVQKEGTVLAFGVPDHLVYPIEYEAFFRKNLALLAVVTPHWSEYLAKARDLYLACQAELDPMITHHFPIESASEAYDLYARHEQGIIKAVLEAAAWEHSQV